jgi:Domain of unknown function (DUF4386)
MTNRAEVSPRRIARVAAVCYAGTILLAPLALFVRGKLVSADAAATAASIMSHQSLFFLSFAADLLATACYVAVVGLFYILLRPVNSTVALVAACFGLVGCAIGGFSGIFQLAPWMLAGGAPYLSAFTLEQAHAMSLVFLKLRGQAVNIGIVFFGFYCLLTGYLVLKSNFLPKVLGALMGLAGVGWLTFIAPPLANALLPFNQIAGGLGEISLTLWLLILGVDVGRWKEQAGMAGTTHG